MLFALRAFIVYVVKSTCKEEEAVFNRMMRRLDKILFFLYLSMAGYFLFEFILLVLKLLNERLIQHELYLIY